MTATKILVVCTANRCRSPIAAAILTQEARRRELELDVVSAGLLPGGQPVPPDGQQVAAEFGLDLRRHRSATVMPQSLVSADLVITMTREHSRTLVAQDQSLWPRIFTLKQLPRWLEERRGTVPPRRTDLRSWIESEGADRDRRELLGRQPTDDVVDPFQAPSEVWRRVVAEIHTLCLASLDLSLPLLRPLAPR